MRPFFKFFGATCLALLAMRVVLAEQPYIGPYLQSVTEDSAVVLWESEPECVGEVELGESETPTQVFREVGARRIHAVRVTGLITDTRYRYRVRWDGKVSNWRSLRTLPPRGTRKFRLAAYGDSRSNPPVHAEIVRRMAAYEPAIVLHTGDLVADGTKREHWKPQFFEPLDPLAGDVPVVPSIGNHEKDSGLYYDYFNLPSKTGWFSYRWANVHFIVLDSQKELNPDSTQSKWLEAELRSSDADWRIVFCHYPMFSCHPTRGINENRWVWQDLFDKHGVDLVLTGHDHYYHRTHRIGRAWDSGSQGVYHITTAGGGASLYPVEAQVYSAFAQSVHHFMIIDIDGRVLKGQAISVDGKLLDSFTIDRTQPEKTPFVSYEMILWEKALREAVEKIPPEAAQPRDGRLERKVKLPSFVGSKNSIAYRWTNGSSFWAADLCDGVVELDGQEPFELSIWGEGPLRAMYPLPRLELRSALTPAEGRDYVNRTITLQPLKLGANQTLQSKRLKGKITVDGKLDEPEWARAEVAAGFTRDHGRIASQREEFRVAHDEVGLVVGARLRSLVEKPGEQGAKDRDTKHMYRTDEAVTVMLSPLLLKQVNFTFCGNSRGTRFDSLNNVLEWNPEWEFATTETPRGWVAEIRIPWIAIGQTAPGQAWKFNLFRWDSRDKALSEWAPTFTPLGTSRKHDGTLTFERSP